MTTNSELQHARPRLRVVSPLAYWICVVYATMNMAIGVSFLLQFDRLRLSASLLIVNHITDFRFWGVLFIVLSVIKAWGLYRNNWHLVRSMLLAGVAVKAMWATALLVRIFISPGTILIAFLWVALAAIQVFTYIFFIPPLPGFGLREDRTDQETSDGRR